MPDMAISGAGMAQWWEHSPPTNVASFHIPELVSYVCLTAVKREKIAKNKKTSSKERLSLLLFKVWYIASILLIY